MKKSEIREQHILEFIAKEIGEKGYPPTVREICNALNIKSTSTVHKSLDNLRRNGKLTKDPSKPRALTLVDKSLIEDFAHRSESSEPDTSHLRSDVIDVPIVGRIAAGTPITADEHIEDMFPMPAQYVNGESFMLRVSGESMVNAGIMDGDLILVEKCNTARNGEIVVAMVDGFESEATVKTFFKEDGHFRLQPENDNMSPIIVESVSILGRVKGVFRYIS